MSMGKYAMDDFFSVDEFIADQLNAHHGNQLLTPGLP